MSKLLLHIFITTLLILTAACSDELADNPHKAIIGEWKGKNGEPAVFVFHSDETATLFMDGRRLEIDQWRLDQTQDPMHLDLEGRVGGRTRTLVGITGFIDDNTLNIKIGFNGQRPKGFFGRDRIILERQ
jgi:hypothetical protein